METRANYVLIGAFAIAGFLGILAFFLWFARIELDRQFAYYDINFPTVSGLATASEVRFAGLPVGQVVDVRLALDGTGQIRVRIEIAAETPVRINSVATIESLGVTGVSYVGLSSGDPREPLLRAASGEAVPMITAGRSTLQALGEDAPELVEEVLSVARQLGEILGEENQARITAILTNLEQSSGNLGQVLDDFSKVTGTVATASEQIAAFSTRLDAISNAATTALETADTTLRQISDLAARAEQTLQVGEDALISGRQALTSADAFIVEDLPRLVDDLNATAARLREQLDLVGTDARAMMDELRKTGSLASARLAEAETTLKSAETTLDRMNGALTAFDDASRSFQVFVDEDGTALVAETRAMIANAETVIAAAAKVAETDLPLIVEDVRTATATAARVVEEVGADLSSAAGRVDGLSASAETALATVTDTFTRANETLAKLNGALEKGDSALAAADKAFTSADRIMGEEVQGIIADLRATLDRLDRAMAQVSEDLPVITSELRATAEKANATLERIQGAVSEASPPISDFARNGLPQYTRLARETRTLIENLDGLVRRIERDPARYLLGGDVPEFRRGN